MVRRTLPPARGGGQAGAVDYVVDGMNVIGSRPDGWWRDRAGARRRLVEALARFAAAGGHRVIVVFDGRPGPREPPTGPRPDGTVSVRFAPGGPDAADRAIVRLVRGLADPAAVVVVTSDGALAGSVHAAGAAVEPATGFLARVDASAGG